MSSSAARALRVLDQVAASDKPPGVTEIARVLSLPPGTVFRSLDALARAGLVARYRASSRYIPGPMAEHLHRSIIARFSIREVCLPYLRQLASISGETVSLHVPVGWHAVRICSVPGMAEVMTSRPAGEAQPLHESPAGKVILAGLPKSELASYRKWVKSVSGLDVAPQVGRAGKGRGETVFPVQAEQRVIAAITFDAPFAPSGEQLSACRDAVANIQTLALAQPGLFAGPFSHLSADAIAL